MRGTVAKRLRRQAREESRNAPTRATLINRIVKKFKDREGKIRATIPTSTLQYTGFRRRYQDLKRDHKRGPE